MIYYTHKNTMLSIILASIGYIFLGIVFILDKYILTDTSIQKPEVYTFYSTFFMIGVLAILPFGNYHIDGQSFLYASISGISFGLALYSMFIALKKSEASHMSPFIGGITSLAIYSIAHSALQETFSTQKQLAIVFLIIATAVLSIEKTKNQKGITTAYLYGGLAGVLYGVSHVSAKIVYETNPFITGFIWTRATVGIIAFILLFFPAVKNHLTQLSKRSEIRKQKNTLPLLVFFDKILAIIAIILIQYAIAIGSVSIVGALAGIQYVSMFIIIYLLTKLRPHIFKEYFTKTEITLQICALILVTFGYILLI